ASAGVPFWSKDDSVCPGPTAERKYFVPETRPGKVARIPQLEGKIAMNKATLALLIHGGTENWAPERWKRRFDEVCGDRPVWLLPDGNGDPADVHYAAVWKPGPRELAGFPNLRVI